jgi:hypothetical protein
MIREMIRRPRYVFDRALGVIINSYIIVATVYLVDHLVIKGR